MSDPLSAAIKRVRTAAGSHDKLAVKIEESIGRKPTRAGLVTWENGTVPSGNYREALIKLGVEPSLFPSTKKLSHLARVEAEVLDLRESVQFLLEVSLLLAGQVVKLGGEIPKETLDALQRAVAGRPT